MSEVVETVQEGWPPVWPSRGQGTPVRVGTICAGCACSTGSARPPSWRWSSGTPRRRLRHRGPPRTVSRPRPLAAFEHLRRESVPFTIHAGEAHGCPASTRPSRSAAPALGHGVRITEDIVDGKLGRLASWVRDRRVALEMCPTSNLQTGCATSIAEHPITELKDLGFRVTLTTDNRLVSAPP
ncbi:hypothetical protein [Streptomyces scabiei]|uniref:hypothetical protein n=1 Tax=Streptomyces scabiei TaxID=1930 RepID=UPI002FF18E41